MEAALRAPDFKLYGNIKDDAFTDIEGDILTVSRTTDDLKSWLNIFKLNKLHDEKTRLLLHLRASFALPRSYKIWDAVFSEFDIVLDELQGRKRHKNLSSVDSALEQEEATVEQLKEQQPLAEAAASTVLYSYVVEAMEVAFKKAIAHLPTLPMLRLRYCDFLWKRKHLVTETRRQYDEALRVIPITQHHLIWRRYLQFIMDVNLPLTTKVVLKRFVQLFPEYSELYFCHLQKIGHYDEAAVIGSDLIRNVSFQSMIHGSKQEQWLDLCLFLSKNANQIKAINGASIIRMALTRFPEDTASLWCCLATHYGVLGNFDRCCHVYEEALNEIRTTKDFKVVFESYATFLEASISSAITKAGSEKEVAFRINKLERLLDTREELLSSVRIRRNPNDVHEWLNRVHLYCRGKSRKDDKMEDEIENAVPNGVDQGESPGMTGGVFTYSKESVTDPTKIISTFSEAIQTVDPIKCLGPSSLLWIEFAHFYELYDEVDEARKVLKRGCERPHKNLDSLVAVWCERIELELRHQHYTQALSLVRESLLKRALPENKGGDNPDRDLTDADFLSDPLQYRLHRSPKLWSLCADLEESFGTFQSMRSVYDNMFELKVITIPQVIGLGEILEKKGLYEDSFQVYEKGVNLFRWPHLNELWMIYLSKFVSRFGSRKLDRARELFERVLADVPKEYASRFYFIYAKYEEHFGLIRNALSIYHRAIANIPDRDKLAFYKILIFTVAEYFGLTKTRQIFDEALKNVADDDVKDIGLWYANMEASLIEIDRARAIYEYVASFCNPKTDTEFWKAWRQFELTRGDEETFREMLRKRRAVNSQFEEMNALKFDEELPQDDEEG